MSSTTYTVSGMTCEHCAASVKEEISAIPGVESVTVDLESGSVAPASPMMPLMQPSRKLDTLSCVEA